MGKKSEPNPTDRGKQGVKRSVLVDGHGVPLAVRIDGANRPDMKLVEPTVNALIPPEPPEAVLQGICLDKGYDYQAVRDFFTAREVVTHIRSRGEEKKAMADLPGYRASLGRRTAAQLDEPLSPSTDPFGKESR